MNIIQTPPTDEQIMTRHLREVDLNRKRVATFYQKHKEGIKEKRRLRYAANKKQVTEVVGRMGGVAATTATRRGRATQDVDLAHLRETIIANTDSTTNTRKTYLSNANCLFLYGGCNDLISCIRDYEKLSNALITAVDAKTGQTPSSNTLKGRFQLILLILDKYYTNRFSKVEHRHLHDYYKPLFDRYNMLSNLQTQANKEREVPAFEDYLARVVVKFSARSKENLIATLFSVLTLRNNDYSKMKIISSSNSDDNINNFIVINGTDPIKFIMNAYKTNKKYKKFTFVLNPDDPEHVALTHLINWWCDSKKKKDGDFFIERGGDLSKFINVTTRSIGYHTEPNIYRHMRAAALSNREGLSDTERADAIEKLSSEMLHSPMTHLNYARQLIKVKK